MIDEATRVQYQQFVQDETGAIDQLRLFVGGRLGKKLDESRESVNLLDQFLSNLLSRPNWHESPLFTDVAKDMRTWLAVRLAYYIAAVLRRGVGGDWSLNEQEASPFYGLPVFRVRGHELSPLEIGFGLVDGDLTSIDGAVSVIEQQFA